MMKNRKIVLIDPPGWQGAVQGKPASPNNGIAYLTTVLKACGWTVDILDMNNERHSETEVAETVVGNNADAVGISCKTATWRAAASIIRCLRERQYRGKIVLGGPHITLNAMEIAPNCQADCLFEGDGETDLPPVLDFLMGDDPQPELKYGHLVHVAEHLCIYRRDALQPIPENIFPDYSGFPQNVREYLKEHYPVFSSRGCPYHCIYCSVPLVSGAIWRGRSVDSIIAELKHAVETYQIRRFEILDDSWNIRMDRCKEMCRRLIAENPELSCSFPNGIRADLLDEELVSLLKQVHCSFVAVGFENTDPEVFENIRKGSSIPKIIRGIKLLKKARIPVSAFFIVGLPLDTFQKEKRNIRFIRSLKIKAFFNLLIPYPHTQVAEYVSAQGKMLADPEDSLHFCNHLEEIPVVCEYPYFPAEQIRRAFIIACIAGKNYENLSARPMFSIGYYCESMKMIFKYAPEYLPEFLLEKVRNVFIRFFCKLRGEKI